MPETKVRSRILGIPPGGGENQIILCVFACDDPDSEEIVKDWYKWVGCARVRIEFTASWLEARAMVAAFARE